MIDDIKDCVANIDLFDDLDELRAYYLNSLRTALEIERTATRALDGEALARMLWEVRDIIFALQELAYAFACRFGEPIHDDAVLPNHLVPALRPEGATEVEHVTQQQIEREINAYMAEHYPHLVPRPVRKMR